jgi:hypothetical protein
LVKTAYLFTRNLYISDKSIKINTCVANWYDSLGIPVSGQFEKWEHILYSLFFSIVSVFIILKINLKSREAIHIWQYPSTVENAQVVSVFTDSYSRPKTVFLHFSLTPNYAVEEDRKTQRGTSWPRYIGR